MNLLWVSFKELEMGSTTKKKSFKKPVERKEQVKKQVQFQEPPKPNFYGLM